MKPILAPFLPIAVGEPILPTDPPKIKLEKALYVVKRNLIMVGLNGDVMRKARKVCPDLIQQGHELIDEIKLQFISRKSELHNPESWEEFVRIYIVACMWGWAAIVETVNGKLNLLPEQLP